MPASAFKVIESEFFRGLAKTILNGPAAEGDPQQLSQCPTIATSNLVGEKVFHFPGNHVPGDEKRALITDDPGVARSPVAGGPADLPTVTAVVRVRLLDAITLRPPLEKGG